MILFMPVRYEAYVEKYDELIYECQFTYLKWIYGHFSLKDGIKKHEVRAFGKILYEEKAVPKKEEKPVHDKVASKEQKPQKTKESTIKKHGNIKSEKPTHKVSNIPKVEKKIDIPVAEETQEEVKEIFDESIEEIEAFGKGLKYGQIKDILLDKDVYRLIKEIYNVFKSIIKYILPREWSYELIIGKEDPADTGECIAKLTLLYPLYYKHGIIRGDFQREGIWGGFLAKGRFNIFGILKRIVRFLIQPVVRKYIKIILDIRKEEKNGE